MQRKTFIQQTGAAAAGIMVSGLSAQNPTRKKRVAVVGTGGRALDMWTRPVLSEFADIVEFVGLCDINQGRVETAKKYLGLSCPTFTDFDEMMQTVKPDDLIVTTVDGTHHRFIIKGMEYGADIITEKPMTIDEQKCQAILDTEQKTGRKIKVTFNYRYSPHRQKMYELLRSGVIGDIRLVDFHWYLDIYHGADSTC
jgi:predicted dehydrogenase